MIREIPTPMKKFARYLSDTYPISIKESIGIVLKLEGAMCTVQALGVDLNTDSIRIEAKILKELEGNHVLEVKDTDLHIDSDPINGGNTKDEYCKAYTFDGIDKKDRETEKVNHPSHYNQGNIEVIDFIEDQDLGFHEGNIVKYVCRAKFKGKELEDLKKALFYLERKVNLE